MEGQGRLGEGCGQSPRWCVEGNPSRGLQLPSQWPPCHGGPGPSTAARWVIAAPGVRAPSCGAAPGAGRVASAPAAGAGVWQVRAQLEGRSARALCRPAAPD